jgi:hypothetical protein
MMEDKGILDKQLGDLFRQMPIESPSSGFAEKLNLRLEAEDRKKAFRRKCLYIGQIAAIVAAVLLLPFLVIHFLLPDFSISFPKVDFNVKIDSTVVIIGVSTLILLVSDTLLRKKYFSQE